MVRWDSTQISIGDIRDLTNSHRLELRPDYQRKEVWAVAAKIMLIDSILKNIPMPKFYLLREVRGEATFRAVIDGQQRLRAILDFMDNKFALKSPPCEEHLHNKYFHALEQPDRDQFINYRIDMYEVTSGTDEEVRQMYSRVNKYVKPLNKQELRRADFPGDFLKISEGLALSNTLEEFNIFTPANRRRMADVEFVSELLALLIRERPLDKKDQLDDVYEEFKAWSEPHRGNTLKLFDKILTDCKAIFNRETSDNNALPPLGKTRFRQKADFYALVGAVSNLHRLGGNLTGRDLNSLRSDLTLLNSYIEPSSSIEVLKDYAIRCVSDANSASSRRWRINFLESILCGTYLKKLSKFSEYIFSRILYDMLLDEETNDSGIRVCAFSGKEFSPRPENSCLGWMNESDTLQISNAQFISRELSYEAKNNHWYIIDSLEILADYRGKPNHGQD